MVDGAPQAEVEKMLLYMLVAKGEMSMLLVKEVLLVAMVAEDTMLPVVVSAGQIAILMELAVAMVEMAAEVAGVAMVVTSRSMLEI